jgi:hypothetical protein
MPIYFSKEKINLTADDNFITFKNILVRKYRINISPKNKITSQSSYEELYKLDEIDFLKKVNEIKVSVTALYKKD